MCACPIPSARQGRSGVLASQTGFDLNGRSNMREETRYRTIAGTCVAWVIASVMFSPLAVRAQSGVPSYEVDPFLAKLSDNWVVGPLGGACFDAQDHVFVLHRPIKERSGRRRSRTRLS